MDYDAPGDDPKNEQILVTAIKGDILTVIRGYNWTAHMHTGPYKTYMITTLSDPLNTPTSTFTPYATFTLTNTNTIMPTSTPTITPTPKPQALVLGYYNSSETDITLVYGQGKNLPNPAFVADWWNSTDYNIPTDDPLNEQILVTSKNGDTVELVRGYEGPSFSHNINGKNYMIAGIP